MRLRNRHTGEIVNWEKPISYKLGKKYYSIKDFTDDWEDAPALKISLPDKQRAAVKAFVEANALNGSNVRAVTYETFGDGSCQLIFVCGETIYDSYRIDFVDELPGLVHGCDYTFAELGLA